MSNQHSISVFILHHFNISHKNKILRRRLLILILTTTPLSCRLLSQWGDTHELIYRPILHVRRPSRTSLHRRGSFIASKPFHVVSPSEFIPLQTRSLILSACSLLAGGRSRPRADFSDPLALQRNRRPGPPHGNSTAQKYRGQPTGCLCESAGWWQATEKQSHLGARWFHQWKSKKKYIMI